ncbi:MAG: hypothetical protein ACFFDF_03685 [Candidatus Odinarchaeota archaeon]
MDRTKNFKWFFKYLGIFFFVIIIGTLVHELGHYIVAVIYGIPVRISYAYTTIYGSLTADQWFWFIMGGPLVSWLVSIMGIIIIFSKYRHMHSEQDYPIGISQTISIVAISFSIRFVFNAGLYFINTTLFGMLSGTDETLIAIFLGISPDILMYGSAVVALGFIIIGLYYIPRFQRYIILFGGIIGGVIGYLFWYYWVGPIILP